MKLYKLTDERGQTLNGCQWGPGITHDPDELEFGDGPLCSGQWYHAYVDPILAVMMNPVHGNFRFPRLWEAEGIPDLVEPDKVGCKSLTVIKEIALPEVTTGQRVTFGILVALDVYDEPGFVAWARGWLSGEDRSTTAAADAADAIFRAIEAHAPHVAYAPMYAADAATDAAVAAEAVFRYPETHAQSAARAAARAARAAIAVEAAVAAAMDYRIDAAAHAASHAAAHCVDIDLVALAHKAIGDAMDEL